jgi:hypothetical protein
LTLVNQVLKRLSSSFAILPRQLLEMVRQSGRGASVGHAPGRGLKLFDVARQCRDAFASVGHAPGRGLKQR